MLGAHFIQGEIRDIDNTNRNEKRHDSQALAYRPNHSIVVNVDSLCSIQVFVTQE